MAEVKEKPTAPTTGAVSTKKVPAPEIKAPIEKTPYEIFHWVQHNMRVPKSRFNKFASFWYRSVEDIYKAWTDLGVPLVLKISDEVIERGTKVFVEAIAEIKDLKGNLVEFAKAQAELGTGKAGMSSEQATGSASSYARKYALNGLFLLDDNKDPDEDVGSTKGSGKSGSTLSVEEAEKAKVKIKELQDIIRGDKVLTTEATKLLAGRHLIKLTAGELDEIIKKLKPSGS